MGILERLAVRKVVNACGPETRVGGSVLSSEVVEAMAEVAQSFVDMNELHERVGRMIADLIGAEASYVTSGASAGLVLATAACITGTDLARISRLPDTEGMKNEVVIQRLHITPFAQSFRMAGARLVEVGDALETRPLEIEDAINEKTAAVAYVFWPNLRRTVSLDETVGIAHKKGVPTIVDAAFMLPPVENLRKFLDIGADLVVFSGGKAIQGPNSTGIILGRANLIKACALQACPNFGVGRPMKVSKEQIVGLLVALERYLKRNHQDDLAKWNEKARYLVEKLERVPHIEVRRVFPDENGLPVPSVQVVLDEKSCKKTAKDVVDALKAGDPGIRVGEQHVHRCVIELHVTRLRDGEEQTVAERLRRILTADDIRSFH